MRHIDRFKPSLLAWAFGSYRTSSYFSSHHSFSFRTCSSSAGVKSFLMLKVFLISSGVLPLVILEEVSVPGGDVICPLLLVLVILRWGRVILVISGPGDHLLQNGSIHIWQGDNFLIIVVHAKILQHGLDCHRLLCNLDINREDLTVTRLELDGRHLCALALSFKKCYQAM